MNKTLLSVGMSITQLSTILLFCFLLHIWYIINNTITITFIQSSWNEILQDSNLNFVISERFRSFFITALCTGRNFFHWRKEDVMFILIWTLCQGYVFWYNLIQYTGDRTALWTMSDNKVTKDRRTDWPSGRYQKQSTRHLLQTIFTDCLKIWLI